MLELVSRVEPLRGDASSGLWALAMVAMGDIDDALARTAEAHVRHLHAGFAFLTIAALEARIATGNYQQIERELADARSQVVWMRMIAPFSDRAEATALTAQGDHEGARRTFQSALTKFAELGAKFEIARTREAMAEVMPEQRDGLLNDALATYTELRAEPRISGVQHKLTHGRDLPG